MTLLSRVCDWIGRKTNTIVMIPHPIVVGNCAEEILYGLLKARKQGKKLVLLHQYPLPWPLNYRLTNADLIDVDSDFRAFSRDSGWHVLGSALVTVYAGICRILLRPLRRLGYTLDADNYYPGVGHSTLWQPEEVMPDFSWDVVAGYEWPKVLQEPFPVYLSKRKKAEGRRELKRMGLPDDAWFVCLHVREGGWHGDSMTERNSDILNYSEAIEEVTRRGGWVLRMGDSTMKRLPAMERVIDYPFTASKSYAMDLYLLSECRAYIGMQSGIYSIAFMFRRPMILANMASWFYPFPHMKGDIGVLKHVYSKSKKRFLSVREWMSLDLHATSFRELDDDFVLHENDPEELSAAVREFFDRNGNGEPTPLQREYNELRISRGREILSKPIRPQDGIRDQHQRYRLASQLEPAIGLISDEYLRKNWHGDARN